MSPRPGMPGDSALGSGSESGGAIWLGAGPGAATRGGSGCPEAGELEVVELGPGELDERAGLVGAGSEDRGGDSGRGGSASAVARDVPKVRPNPKTANEALQTRLRGFIRHSFILVRWVYLYS